MVRDDAHDSELETHRRAKANLETLIDTSPVDVVDFDVRRGPISVNRETRMTVDGPGQSGKPSELPLEVLTLCRADGRKGTHVAVAVSHEVWGIPARSLAIRSTLPISSTRRLPGLHPTPCVS